MHTATRRELRQRNKQPYTNNQERKQNKPYDLLMVMITGLPELCADAKSHN